MDERRGTKTRVSKGTMGIGVAAKTAVEWGASLGRRFGGDGSEVGVA
jgi:hypothetical protein